MREYLKHYNLRITALSPIHVGDGGKLGKKEYIQYDSKGPVIVPDTAKMFGDLQRARLDGAYEEFMLSDYGSGLGQWLYSKRINEQYAKRWEMYRMDPGDAFARRTNGGGATPKEILTFMKDPYGNPYIPGSTLKGMLRTALICYRVSREPERYKDKISEITRSASVRASRNKYLRFETNALEAAVFHTLERPNVRKDDAVNSIMSGFIVSDSKPLPLSQLVLAQKIDYTLGRQEKPLPILREALKPGSQIDFELTIDTKTCNITIEEVFSALDYFQQEAYKSFYSRFGRGANAKGTVWLGGGCGFLSKTILYPLCGKDALKTADKIFQTTLGGIYGKHKHKNDISNGVAPHVCKCTRYGGKLYDMGMGKIELLN